MEKKVYCKNCEHELIETDCGWIHKHGFIPHRSWCAVPFERKYAHWDEKEGSWYGAHCGCRKPEKGDV